MDSEKIYKPKLKVFKERAERIPKSEYDSMVGELLVKFGNQFKRIEPTEPMQDKDSFGDIDVIFMPKGSVDEGYESYFREIFGKSFLGYNRTPHSHVHSLLLSVSSQKSVQADFIRAEDQTDFERKLMYYSKGHFSSAVGMMAKKLHFKYSTEGFFKRFKDKRGNWHDIFISDKLSDGLKILGFDRYEFEDIKTTPDIVEFISSSPLFDSSYFQFKDLPRRDRESIKRNAVEEYITQKLAIKNQTRIIDDEDEFFRKFFPEEFEKFKTEAERIEKETYKTGNINGEVVMKIFGLKPGPEVGRVLKFISDFYPNLEELSDNVIQDVKNNILEKEAF